MSDLADKLALASCYNVLSGCVTLEVSLFKTGIDELRTLESENARLRKAIEDAPHDYPAFKECPNCCHKIDTRYEDKLEVEIERLKNAIREAPIGVHVFYDLATGARLDKVCTCPLHTWQRKALGEQK